MEPEQPVSSVAQLSEVARNTGAVVMVCAALVWARPSLADDAGSADRDRAIELYTAGDFRAAADAFADAYRDGRDPALLFAWAQAERKANRCKRAIKLYRGFIATEPPASDIEAAKQGMAMCNEQLDAARPPPPWYSDVTAGVFAGSGIVLASVGLGYQLSARSALDEAAKADDTDDFEDAADKAKGHMAISYVTATAGAALLAYGIFRYLHRDDGRRATVAPTANADGAGVVVFGRF